MSKSKPQLESGTIWLMIAVALFYDALQALLDLIAIGWLFVPVAYMHFWLWFKLKGIDFFSAKRASTIGAGMVFELLTAGILPAMTFTVARIAFDHKVKQAGAQVVGNIKPSADNQSDIEEAA
jgi:hypothetical protein